VTLGQKKNGFFVLADYLILLKEGYINLNIQLKNNQPV
jgi:hypothetical protein